MDFKFAKFKLNAFSESGIQSLRICNAVAVRQVTLSGYTEPLLQFTKTFLHELVNFDILEEKFEVFKETVSTDSWAEKDAAASIFLRLVFETLFSVHSGL